MADDEVPVLSGGDLTRETDKRLRAFFKADREVLERGDEIPPDEAAAQARTGDHVAELRDQLWAVERQARAQAIAEWEAAHPLELPQLPWWPRWRRQFTVQVRERMRLEYEENPDRRHFVEEAVRAEAERFYAAFRQEHGFDFLEELGEAYAADSVSRVPAGKRANVRGSAWLRIQGVVRVLYERHHNDVRWVADYLGTTQVKIRSYLGLPEPRARGHGYGSGGGVDGGFWAGDSGGGGEAAAGIDRWLGLQAPPGVAEVDAHGGAGGFGVPGEDRGGDVVVFEPHPFDVCGVGEGVLLAETAARQHDHHRPERVEQIGVEAVAAGGGDRAVEGEIGLHHRVGGGVDERRACLLDRFGGTGSDAGGGEGRGLGLDADPEVEHRDHVGLVADPSGVEAEGARFGHGEHKGTASLVGFDQAFRLQPCHRFTRGAPRDGVGVDEVLLRRESRAGRKVAGDDPGLQPVNDAEGERSGHQVSLTRAEFRGIQRQLPHLRTRCETETGRSGSHMRPSWMSPSSLKSG